MRKIAIVLALLVMSAHAGEPMKSIKDAVTNFPGSRLDAEGFVAQRCFALYMTIASGFADSNPEQKPWTDRGFHFFNWAVNIQKKNDPTSADPRQIADAVKPMTKAYATRANEQRARTGNYMNDSLIADDYRWCEALAKKM